MWSFALIVAALFCMVFFLVFWPLWRSAQLQHERRKCWVILLLGVATPVIALYTTIGALPMVWLAP